MKQIKIEKLNAESFRCFGTYIFINEVFSKEEFEDNWTFELYRGDNLTMSLGKTNTVAGFSFGFLKKRPLIIDSLQAHCHTEKTIIMEKDCALVTAPIVIGNTVGEEKMKAFLIPGGTLLKLNFFTWYTIPFLLDGNSCIYSQCEAIRTYNNDTQYYELKERVEILT